MDGQSLKSIVCEMLDDFKLMFRDLAQELVKLKQDHTFITNLCSSLVIVTCLFLSSEYVNSSPNTLGKREKISQFSNTVSAGMVIKTYQYFYR